MEEFTRDQAALVSRMLMEDKSFWEIRQALPSLQDHQVRRLVQQFASRRKTKVPLPSEEEFQQRKEQIHRAWTEEGAWSRKWVGRYAQAKQETLEKAASVLIERSR